jgi:hypothetical protein
MEFSSTEAYQQPFRMPLLEEFRAQLHQALESSITKGPALPVDITCQKQSNKKLYTKTKVLLESSSWTRSTSESPINGSEIILLCNDNLKWDSTRECPVIPAHDKFRCILASASITPEQETEATAYVRTSDLDFILRSISEEISSWRALRTGMSFIPAQRIWYALDKVIGPINSVPQLFPVIQSILKVKQVTATSDLQQYVENCRTLNDLHQVCFYIPSQC